jgi:hypothetical protein
VAPELVEPNQVRELESDIGIGRKQTAFRSFSAFMHPTAFSILPAPAGIAFLHHTH